MQGDIVKLHNMLQKKFGKNIDLSCALSEITIEVNSEDIQDICKVLKFDKELADGYLRRRLLTVW